MSNFMSYINYQLILEYGKNYDQREYYVQRRLIEPFIQSIVPHLYIEDISVIRQRGNSKRHDRTKYCGINSYGLNTPPDLLIAKEWNYYNIENEVDYRAVVEVKNPFPGEDYHSENKEDDRLHPYDYEEYRELIKDKISWYLSATENDRLILTDGLKWEFYEKKKDKKGNGSNNFKRLKIFFLVDVVKEEKLGGKSKNTGGNIKKTKSTWEWLESDKTYNELVKYIFNFLENKNFKKIDEIV